MADDLILIIVALVGLFLVVSSVSTNLQQTLNSAQFWVGFVIVAIALALSRRR